MEVTLYFDGVEKKLPLKRNTIGLRLEWQLLMSKHSKQATELNKEFSSWKFRAENIQKKLENVDVMSMKIEEYNKLKSIDFDLMAEHQAWTIKSTTMGVTQVIEIIKFITDTQKLNEEQLFLFNSDLEKGKFWQDQDIAKLTEVVDFFRRGLS